MPCGRAWVSTSGVRSQESGRRRGLLAPFEPRTPGIMTQSTTEGFHMVEPDDECKFMRTRQSSVIRALSH